ETVVAEGSRAELSFRAPSRGGLRGTVREGGRPLASARLHLALERAETDEDPSWFSPGSADPFTTSSGSDGSYAFEALPCARARLFVTHASRRMPAVLEVEVDSPPGVRDVDLDVASLEGRVTTEDGSPLPGIEVFASGMTEQEELSGSFRMVLSEDEHGG